LPDIEYGALAPVLILVVGALVIITFASLLGRRPPDSTYALATVVTGGASLGASALVWDDIAAGSRGARYAVAGSVAIDGFAVFFMVVLGVTVVLGALLADSYLRREGLDGPEFYVLALLAASGGMVMGMANDLIVLFLGLEILSISLYVLAGLHLRRAESGEAAIKYLVLGAFSSAFLLYGVALVYGATGTTNLAGIATYLAENVATTNGVLMAGMALLLVGLGFKVAAVPFHTWTPDVYQGAPSPAVGFMAGAAKAAGFAGLLRVFFSTFSVLQVDWKPLVWVLAVLSLVVGSVLAVVQTDVKRMLAYSSIAHAGYVLIGLQAATANGVAGSLFYLFTYTFMVMGSFAVVTLVSRRGDTGNDLESYRGLATRRPVLAFAFTVFLLAQAGVPFTAGFLAKFYVIAAVVETDGYALAIIAMLAAVVAAFFYLRIVLTMYSQPEEAAPPVPVPLPAGAAVAVSVAVTLVVGVLPSVVIDFARDATLLL
jgi:NADH-quinone oxidoreductase subunit N